MITAFFRTVLLYVLLIIGLRLTGKRQIGQLEPIEFVLMMLLSDLASVPMQDFGLPLLQGVIPIAMNDLVRTVISTALGDAVCGAIAFSMGVESRVPSGGMFVVPTMTNPG